MKNLNRVLLGQKKDIVYPNSNGLFLLYFVASHHGLQYLSKFIFTGIQSLKD